MGNDICFGQAADGPGRQVSLARRRNRKKGRKVAGTLTKTACGVEEQAEGAGYGDYRRKAIFANSGRNRAL